MEGFKRGPVPQLARGSRARRIEDVKSTSSGKADPKPSKLAKKRAGKTTKKRDLPEVSEKAHEVMTDKQRAFCAEYLVDLNATQAAIRAGYSESTARSIGHENLTKPDIEAEIQRLMKERASRVEVTSDMVLRELLNLACVDVGQVFGENGSLLPIHSIPENVRKAISGIDVYEEYAGHGEDRENIGQTKKLRFWDKTKALEMLGRHLKMFTEKLEHSGPNGGPIQTEAKARSEDEAKAFAEMLARADVAAKPPEGE